MKWITWPPTRAVKILLSFLHALLMLVMVFAWNNSDYSFELESAFLRKLSLLKKNSMLDRLQDKYVTGEDVLFVSTSSTGKIVQLDEEGNNTWTTDRKKLAEFLSFVRRYANGHPLILCDYIFELPSEDDSLLRRTIDSMQHIFFPTITPGEDFPAVLQNLPGGYTDYTISSKWWKFSSKLNKIALTKPGGEKSLALLMAEKYLGTTFTPAPGMLKAANRYYFNTVFLDPEVSTYQLQDETIRRNKIYSLSDLLSVKELSGDSALIPYLQKSFIVIGDFDKDLHDISSGPAPGPLIQFNAMVSVINQENRIGLIWVLLLTSGFFFLSYITFFSSTPAWVASIHRLLQSLVGKIGDELITNISWLYILAFFSYMVFNVTIEVIGLVVWLTAVKFITGSYKRYMQPQGKGLRLWPRLVFVLFDYLPNKQQ